MIKKMTEEKNREEIRREIEEKRKNYEKVLPKLRAFFHEREKYLEEAKRKALDLEGDLRKNFPRNLVITGGEYILEISIDRDELLSIGTGDESIRDGKITRVSPLKIGVIYNITGFVGKFVVENMMNGRYWEGEVDEAYVQTGVRSPFI